MCVNLCKRESLCVCFGERESERVAKTERKKSLAFHLYIRNQSLTETERQRNRERQKNRESSLYATMVLIFDDFLKSYLF